MGVESTVDSRAMGFRFHRSIKIFPGVRVNLGKRGVSTSIGVRGAHVTIGRGKVRETLGLPGTGLSFTHTSGTQKAASGRPTPARVVYPGEPVERYAFAKGLLVFLLAIVIGLLIQQILEASR